MHTFKVGDRVRLVSGGPEMTVVIVRGTRRKSLVVCEWWAKGVLKRDRFTPDVLVADQEVLETVEAGGAGASLAAGLDG